LREYWCGAWRQYGNRQAIATILEDNKNLWRLVVKVVLPGDICRGKVCSGAWRLATRVLRQAVWKRGALGDL